MARTGLLSALPRPGAKRMELMKTLYRQAERLMGQVADLDAAAAVFNWDQETLMPPGALNARAETMAGLSSMSHSLMTQASTISMAEEIRANLEEMPDFEQGILRCFLRDFDRLVKLPDELVRETAMAEALAGEAWKTARANDDFAEFQPHLSKLIELKSRAAELYGYEGHKLDALMDLFEPGLTVATVDPVFARLKAGVSAMLDEVREHDQPDDSYLTNADVPSETQMRFARDVATKIGFDFNCGRLDLSAHPFCTNFSHSDVRLTTRVEDDLRTCLFSVIHEAGHGMYEQGIDPRYARSAAAGGVSMGIHESQSLFWEDIVARSREFWQWLFPQFRDTYMDANTTVDAEQMYRAVNLVRPGLIRIAADELTYHMHIILRYEIERSLFSGELRVEDIPAFWNEKMRDYLGIVPPNNALGCLQDVHWSFGGFGYFPSYSLGKLYAAMMWAQVQQDMPDVRSQIAVGNFSSLLDWLRRNVHQYGRTRDSRRIITDISGRELTEKDYLAYMRGKIDDIYGA